MTSPAAEPITGPVARHGEGPFWDEDLQALLWVDMLAGCVLTTELDGVTHRFPVGSPVAALIRPTAGGRHVVVTERGIVSLDLANPDEPVTPLVDLHLPAGVRANDGAVATDGGLYVGTMAWDESPEAGNVLHIDRDLFVREVLAGATVANGMHACNDGTVLFIDSPRRAVMRYRLDPTGAWTEPKIAVDLSHWTGVPDGMCVDAEGGMWIAHWDGHEVARYNRDGSYDITVHVPPARPTSCALGGPAGRHLFITTSSYGRDIHIDPLAGALFVVEVDIPAAASQRCALPAQPRGGTPMQEQP